MGVCERAGSHFRLVQPNPILAGRSHPPSIQVFGMNRAPRPKERPTIPLVLSLLGALLPAAVRAQSPMASTYATRDGRILGTVLSCPSQDGTFTAQPCGVGGAPLHVQVDSGPATTAAAVPGRASAQVIGVQGGGAGALPVAVAQSGTWTLALPSGAHVSLDAGGNVIGAVQQSGAWSVNVGNLPATQAVSATALPLPAGAAVAALQPALNADGGALVHLANPLPAGTASIGTVVEANRSAAWLDASFTVTSTASSPAVLAAVASRIGLHVWNLGTATVCLNYTTTAQASGAGCAAGSVPIAAGSAWLEDQPGNVSPEAVSLVCAAASCPLTIKVR